MVSFLNFFNSARNVTVASLVDIASPVILHSKPVLETVRPLFSEDPLLNEVYIEAQCFLAQCIAVSWNIFCLCPSPTHKCNAFSILSKHLSCTVAITFAVWGATTKLAQISFSFFLIHRRFIPTIDLSILSIWSYNFFLIKVKTFSLRGSTFQLPWHISIPHITTLALWGHYKVYLLDYRHCDNPAVNLITELAMT